MKQAVNSSKNQYVVSSRQQAAIAAYFLLFIANLFFIRRTYA